MMALTALQTVLMLLLIPSDKASCWMGGLKLAVLRIRIRIRIIFPDPDPGYVRDCLGSGSVNYSHERNKINWKGQI
jgi:hypothetical protein